MITLSVTSRLINSWTRFLTRIRDLRNWRLVPERGQEQTISLSGHEEGDVRTPDCTQYVYTNISPAFLESAATRYERHQGRMRFMVLNIEVDPSKQGFELGTYDLIIAASVICPRLSIDGLLISSVIGTPCHKEPRGYNAQHSCAY